MLGVLVWKHAVVRKRRFMHTLVEMLAPVILFLLLFLLRNIFANMSPTPEAKAVIEDTPLNELQPVSRVLYTPYSPLTSILMLEVGKHLKLAERNGLPNHFTSGYWAVSNSEVFESFVSKMKYNEAIVIFEDFDGETLPQKLTYTIRMKEPFMTSTVKSLDGVLTAHSYFGDIYSVFMNLQWAIDKSYLKLRSGTDVKKNVTYQEFPYLKNTKQNESYYVTIITLLKFLSVLSLLLPFIFQVLRLLEERASGIVELIKIFGVTTNMVGVSHFLNTVPSGLVYSILVTVLCKVTDTALLPHTGFGYIFVAMFLHYCNVMAMAHPVSYISKTTNYGTTLALLAYCVFFIPLRVVYGEAKDDFVYLTGLLPFVPIYWFVDEIGSFEMYGKSIQMTDIAVRRTQNSAAIWVALLCILVQTALCFMIAWYLDKVRPGAYGVALPWNFMCKKSYWSKKVDPNLMKDAPKRPKEDPTYFEPPLTNQRVGIKVVDVTKIFGGWYGPKNIALSHLTVDFYDGEITVLLGHNGAGKTTLMSIITGMLSSTSGQVLVKGMDNIKQREEVRRHLGFCPQVNMSYNDLTVLEHTMFFSMLKGLNYQNAKSASLNLISKLKLEGKENFKSSQLSGGMKRRLQLACALAGNASVLILDEPTSGLDVETRRELWNLLLSLRGTCTVLISTHFMEEADALGDRVVAIHQGQLRCRATPMYLKKAVGTGYRLSLTLNRSAKESEITNTIRKYIEEAAISDRTSTSISYKLPATSSDAFPKLFNDLESNRTELGIETIGVGVTTLDEVFLKLCSDVDTAEEFEEPTKRVTPVTFKKETGVKLCCRILKILFLRQIIATWSNKWFFLFIQVFIPILAICLSTALLKSEKEKPLASNTPLMLNLDAYKDTGTHTDSILLDMNEKGALRQLRSVVEYFHDFEFVISTNVSEALSRFEMEYYEYLIGLETNDTNVNLRYTTLYRHTAPVALNLYSNFLAMELIPTSLPGRTITTYNFPIDTQFYALKKAFVETKTAFYVKYWCIVVTLAILATLSNEVTLPCKERIQGSRHIQIMSGCSPALYWLVTLLYDYIIYLIFMVLVAVIACLFLDSDNVFSALDFLGTFVVVLLLGGLAYLLFAYYISFFYNERSASIVLIVLMFVHGLVLPLFVSTYGNNKPKYVQAIDYISLCIPAYTFSTAILKVTATARANSVCRANAALCPDVRDAYSQKFSEVCCNADLSISGGPFSYFVMKSGLREIIATAIQILIYGLFVILLEYGLAATINSKLVNLFYKPLEKKFHDDMVTKEQKYCEKSILKKTKPQDAVLIHNLHKYYMACFGKSVRAVRGTNISIKKGECFGLLGVNGAGKSTTFKMLTGEEACTRGNLYANGYSISQRSNYLYSMSYCPQFGGLDMFLTGEQNLRQLLVIRGLNDTDVHREAKIWLAAVGLEQYAHREASGYSGGCLRRLAAALSLASGAPVSLLDEPTSGVDTAARRRVWIALKRGLAQKRSVIITSHSMDEMEALCNRIAIMSHGEICALGSSPALRAAHGVGLSLRLKLKGQEHPKDGPSVSKATILTPVERLKADLLKTYPGRVRDEHSTMLHYHIDNKVPYSEVFQYMETLRSEYPDLLEDYSVTETTLEEVFLSFARNEDTPAATP